MSEWYQKSEHNKNLEIVKKSLSKTLRIKNTDFKVLDLKHRSMNPNDPLGNPVFFMRKDPKDIPNLNRFAAAVMLNSSKEPKKKKIILE